MNADELQLAMGLGVAGILAILTWLVRRQDSSPVSEAVVDAPELEDLPEMALVSNSPQGEVSTDPRERCVEVRYQQGDESWESLLRWCDYEFELLRRKLPDQDRRQLDKVFNANNFRQWPDFKTLPWRKLEQSTPPVLGETPIIDLPKIALYRDTPVPRGSLVEVELLAADGQHWRGKWHRTQLEFEQLRRRISADLLPEFDRLTEDILRHAVC